jgi:hypothetical protein
MFSAGYSTMENQTTYPTAHFSNLAHGDKVWAGVLFGGVSLVLAVLTALAVHCYHRRWGSARAQHARDADEAARASEVQLSAAHLAASQVRTQELELELAAAHERTSSLQAQVVELERRFHEIFEELRQERQKASVLERKLSLTEQARDLEKEAQQTSYAMYKEAAREVEELQGLLAVQVEPRTGSDELPEPDVHALPSEPPMMAAAPPAFPAAEAHESESDYFSAA